jgi:hypothetical protein
MKSSTKLARVAVVLALWALWGLGKGIGWLIKIFKETNPVCPL